MRQFLCAAFLLFGFSSCGFCETRDKWSWLIEEQAMGRVKLGMTLAQIREVVRPMKLRKVQGLEGIPAVEIYSDFPYIRLYFDDYYQPRGENEQYKIKESSKVVFIHELTGYLHTSQGVFEGIHFSDLEARFGKADEIILDTEGGIFATFEALPYTYFILPHFLYKKGQPNAVSVPFDSIDGFRLSPRRSNSHGTD